MNNVTRNLDILDSIVDSISIVNSSGEIVFTNASWQKFSSDNSGNAKNTCVGINYIGVCGKVNGEEFEKANEASEGIQKVINKQIPFFELEYPCHSIDERRWFIMRVNPLSTSPDLTLITHINITNRKLSEEKNETHNQQLKIINERLNTTLLKIVHDIQSPLTSIEGLVDLTRMDDEKHAISPYFAMIEQSITNLKKYIQDTLNMFSEGLIIESINFKDLINDFFESIKHAEVLKLFKITIAVDQDIDFRSDKAEINLIISNIINNCLKYYDKNKQKNFITIDINVNEHEACVSILDNGIGIQEEAILKIFDLNFQENVTFSTGAGIGLYLVKKSIVLLNGTIKTISTSGVGTEFIINIPNSKKN